MHAVSGSSGSMVKPVASMVAKTPPVRGLVVHWPPHSTIFATCQVGPAGMPFISGYAAATAVSVARPARTTWAPASRAATIGSWPIIPTMWVQLSSVSASRSPIGGSGWIRPASSASLRSAASCSL